MPRTSDNQASLADLISGSPARAAPLVVAADASSFGLRAGENVTKLVPDPWRSMLLTASLTELSATLAQVDGQEFRLQPRAVEIWNEQPPWLIVFASGTSSTDEVLARVNDRRQQGLHNIRLLVFLCCSTEESKAAQQPVNRLQEAGAVVCLVSPDAVTRSVEDLAEGAAVYVATSWISYCQAGSGDVKVALDLPSERSIFSLGMGIHRPDPAFHTPRLATNLAMGLREAWLLQGSVASDEDVFPDYLVGITSLLPDDRYVTRKSGDTDEPALHLRRTDPIAHIKSLAAVRARRVGQSTTSLAQWFARLREVRLFDKNLAAEFQQTTAFVKKQTEPLVQRWHKAVVAFVRLAEHPGSALADLKQRLTVAEDRVRGWVDAEAVCGIPLSSLDADCALMKRRILAIPSLGGAALRLFLLALGLTWLVIGPWVFGTGLPLFTDARFATLAVCAGASLLLIFAIAVVQCYLMIRWVWRSEDVANRRCVLRHAMQITRFLKQELANRFAGELQQLRDQRQKLHDCEQWLTDERFDFPKPPMNHAPEFDDHTLTRMANEHRTDEVQALHNAVRARLVEQGLILYDAKLWQETFQTLALDHARQRFEQWLYGEWVIAADLSESERSRLVNGVVRLAQQAAFAAPSDPNVRVRLVVPVGQRDQWTACLGRNDTVRMESVLATRSLVAVSAIPLHRTPW